MQRQFSQQSFSQVKAAPGYLHDETPSPLWRRFVPVLVVVSIAAAACYGGLSAGKKMAGDLAQLDIVQADPQLTQRATIGADAPDLMMPQPTFAPPALTVVSLKKPMRRVPRPKVAS